MIISFYSYKGGVGRTQLLANVAACLCYDFKKKVLVIDWDLEAPGLHYFFKKETDVRVEQKEGVIDLLNSYMRYMDALHSEEPPANLLIPTFNETYIYSYDDSKPNGCLDLVSSGRAEGYFERLDVFDWDRFYKRYDGKHYIEWLKTDLKNKYDYILIDSRTGRTPYGGIVNTQMAQVSVFVMAPTEQNFKGCLDIIKIIEQSNYAKDFRKNPLIMPILARVDIYEATKLQHWTERFKTMFADYYRYLLHRAGDDVSVKEKTYINDTIIEHYRELSFGENLLFPILKEPDVKGFETQIRHIAHIFECIEHPVQYKVRAPNLLYSDNLLHSNKIQIKDNFYSIEEDFKQNLLWIDIHRNKQPNQYDIHVWLKTNRIATPLLKQPVSAEIPAATVAQSTQLYDIFHQYQQSIFRPLTISLLDAEEALSTQLLSVFLKGDIEIVCRDFVQMIEQQRIIDLLIVIASDDPIVLDLPFERTFSHFLTLKTQQTHPIAGLVRTKMTHFSAFNTFKNIKKNIYILKVLFIVVLPENLEEVMSVQDAVAFATAQHQLMAAMEEAHEAKCWVELLYPASLAEMDTALRLRKHDVVHVSTYSVYSELEQVTMLYFEQEQGQLELVSSNALGVILKKYDSVKLLVLNVFEANHIPLGAQVEGQIAADVPSLVTVRFTDMAEEAAVFTMAFYTALAHGATIIDALHQVQTRLQVKRQENTILPVGKVALPITVYCKEWLHPLVEVHATKNLKSPRLLQGFVPTKNTRLIGSGFIGRKRCLIQLQQAFRAGKHVCLYGLGGLGKTTLAEAFSYQYALQEKATIVIFRGESQIKIRNILDTLTKRLHAYLPSAEFLENFMNGLHPPLEKLEMLVNHYPRKAKLILLFDNCEELQRNEVIFNEGLLVFLQEMCAKAPHNCHLLFTSRYKLKELEPFLTHLVVDKMSEVEQNRLLNQLPALKKMSLSDTERSELYNALGGHPRSYLHLAELLKKDATFPWKEQIVLAKTKEIDGLLLQAVYDRLSVAEQMLFKWVATFRTRTPLSVLADLSRQTVEALMPSLRFFQEASLCHLDEGVQEFMVHPITRDWMQQNVIDATEILASYLIIGRYFKNLVGEIAFSKNINTEYAHLAIDYFKAAQQAGLTEFAELSFTMHRYYYVTGFYEDAFALNKAVLRANISPKINSDALNNKGIIYYIWQNYELAFKYLQSSLEIRDTLADESRKAEIYNNLSLIYKTEQKYDVAKALYYLEQSLAIHEKNHDKNGISLVYNNIGLVHYANKDFDNAELFLNKSLEMELDKAALAAIYTNLAALENDKGKMGDADGFKNALDYLHQALEYQKENEYESANTYKNMGEIYFACKKWPEAIASFMAASVLLKNNGLEKSPKNEDILNRLTHIAEIIEQLPFKKIVDELGMNPL
jgi:MinD-like ATPase involved in chromosome partitioning or flagellar assembly/tetratricopeptide (TPR) repeat protein